MKRRVKVLLDSGAFAAWNRHEVLSVKDYCKFIGNHSGLFDNYVNLDVMPGPNQDHDKAASASLENLRYMRGFGLKPMPVFHYGEVFAWLDQLLSEGYKYIGLGGMAALKPEVKVKWLDTVFTILTDRQGRPLIKLHGFGLTHPMLVTRYPWYSVDSSTWSMFPGYGPILVPAFSGDEPDFSQPPTAVVLSGNVQQSERANAMQYQNLQGLARDQVDRWLEMCRIDITEARYRAGPRRRAMLAYFSGLQKALRGVRFKHRMGLVLTQGFDQLKEVQPLKPWTPRIIHASSLGNKEFSLDLNAMGANDRLLSYYELRKRSSREIEQYVTKGIAGEYAKTRAKANWDTEHYLNDRRIGLSERFK